ncbi:MLO-like protein 11 [Dionaea muscipula]
MEGNSAGMRSLALTPTWSVATVLTIFVGISLLVERSIHHLGRWLQRTNRKPLLQSMEKMKEELMLLGFISLLLTATSSTISNICIQSKFYDSIFAPCSKAEIDEERQDNYPEGRKLLTVSVPCTYRRVLNVLIQTKCQEGYEPFVSYEGLEQLHRFIFIMAVTHISYSCLTMLLAIVKIQSWRAWEDEACADRHDSLTEITKELVTRRQSTFVKFHASNPFSKNGILIWVTCFFRQFGHSVVRSDYLTLRKGFIMNHRLRYEYDFHGYMIRTMEEEFQQVVGVSGPHWGFVVAFMLFNIKGSNLYFWIAIIPISLVLLIGTKLQNVIATLTLESAGISGFFSGTKLKPRDDLFWFKRPELLLKLIHFILFQNSFELASFFWFWWQFGYNSCFISNHLLVYLRLIIGFFGQFLCSYSTLPLYALVTQMGTNYKAALVPQRIRATLEVWKKSAKKKKKRRPEGYFGDDSTTIHTETSTVMSLEDDYDIPEAEGKTTCMYPEAEIELQALMSSSPSAITEDEPSSSSRAGITPLLRHLHSASMSSSTSSGLHKPGQTYNSQYILSKERRITEFLETSLLVACFSFSFSRALSKFQRSWNNWKHTTYWAIRAANQPAIPEAEGTLTESRCTDKLAAAVKPRVTVRALNDAPQRRRARSYL